MPIVRAFAHIVIRGMVPQGFSQRAIMREVRRLGYGYRTRLMGEDIRRFSGRYLNQGYVEKLGSRDIFPRDLMVEAELKRPYKYRVFGEGTYYNEYEDVYMKKEVSMHTDRLMDPEGWESEYIDKMEEIIYDPDWEAVGFDVKSVEHNIGYDY